MMVHWCFVNGQWWLIAGYLLVNVFAWLLLANDGQVIVNDDELMVICRDNNHKWEMIDG